MNPHQIIPLLIPILQSGRLVMLVMTQFLSEHSCLLLQGLKLFLQLVLSLLLLLALLQGVILCCLRCFQVLCQLLQMLLLLLQLLLGILQLGVSVCCSFFLTLQLLLGFREELIPVVPVLLQLLLLLG